MKIKFCGIKYVKDLNFCIENNVDYIGVNFYANSKRFCKNGDILYKINTVELKNTQLVAVLKNPSSKDIEDLKHYNIKIIQLCGDEDLSLLNNLMHDYEVWKSVSLANYEKYRNCCHKLLFDMSHGNGVLFNEDIPEINKSFGVAGGINDSNILEFKDKYNHAEFLDIASGIEENDEFCKEKALKVLNLFYG